MNTYPNVVPPVTVVTPDEIPDLGANVKVKRNVWWNKLENGQFYVSKLDTKTTTTKKNVDKIIMTIPGWRELANSKRLHQFTDHIYANHEEARDGITYIMPQNVLKKFIVIGDLRTQIVGLLYGVSPPDNPQTKEIRCLVMPPQAGTEDAVDFPTELSLPQHCDVSEDLEPLGWVHTQWVESDQLSAQAMATHAKVFSAQDGQQTIAMTCSFTPGSVTPDSVTPDSVMLRAFKLTPDGVEWGKNLRARSSIPMGFSPSHFEKVEIQLSDEFTGFFMVPSDGCWNYNLTEDRPSQDMKYTVKLGIPKNYYHGLHRQSHFLNFNKFEGATLDDALDADFHDPVPL